MFSSTQIVPASTANIISESGFSIGETVVLKPEHPEEERLKRFVVTPKNEAFPITKEQDKALNKFLKEHIIEDSNIYNIVIGDTETNYEFMRTSYVSFRINGEQEWNTIIITSNDVVQKFINGDMSPNFNPIWLHDYEESSSNDCVLPMRSISTYGMIEHVPAIEVIDLYTKQIYPGLEYIIVGIDKRIPNQKPICTGPTESIHLHITPKIGLDINEEIYWYVDCLNNTICQYEDGVPFIKLLSIESTKIF